VTGDEETPVAHCPRFAHRKPIKEKSPMNEKSFHRAFSLRVFGERNMLLKALWKTSGVFRKTSDEIKKTSDEFLKASRRGASTFLLLFRLFSGVLRFNPVWFYL